MSTNYKSYQNEETYSYCLGAYPSFRLLELAPERCLELLFSDRFHEREKAERLCRQESIPFREAPRLLERISRGVPCHMAAVFKKTAAPARSGIQLLLEEVDDMGNLGSVMRSMAAFSVVDLVLLGNCCDLWHPKTVRASMGAVFALRVSAFPSRESWRQAFPDQKLAAFCLGSATEAIASGLAGLSEERALSLAFGNEGRGLSGGTIEAADCRLMIPQSELVDSLNLSEAVAISLYQLRQCRGKL